MEQRAETPVILDTNAVFEYGRAVAHIRRGETPVITSTVAAELRSVARREGMYLPRIARQLAVIEDVVDLDLRIRLRGELRARGDKRGLLGDGRIGATALRLGLPLITFDRSLGTVLLGLGVEVRR